MTAKRAFFQGVAGLVALLLLWPALAHAQQGSLPGLLEQLNRVPPTSTQSYNPAMPLLSPLDQARSDESTQQGSGAQQQNSPGRGLGPGISPLQRLTSPELLQTVRPVPLTPIELDYSRRAGMPLLQYGYDVFRVAVPSRGELQSGAVADNYRLNIGDQLVITLQGQTARSLRTRIDSEGRIVVPDIPPIPAAGRTFGEVRADLERAVAAQLLNTSVFVSVATVRQIAVSVLGEANSPGVYRMGGFATALDALAMAGGVKNIGSLRRITLVRGRTTSTIDLYNVMAGVGAAPDLSLADGDRITIPPIGPTVAVSGEVVRPGIYELAGGGTIGGQALLALAGGPLRPAGNRVLKLSLGAQGADMATDVSSLAQQTIRAGEIVMVLPRDTAMTGTVTLDGGVRVPGVRSLAAAPDLRRLIGSPDALLPSPYLPFGVVVTTDPETRARHLVPVDLAAVMSRRTNMPLKDGDIVVVLSLGDVNYIASADVQAVLEGRPPPLLRQHIVTSNPRAVETGPFAPDQMALHPGDAATALLAQGQAAQATLAAQQFAAAQFQEPQPPPPSFLTAQQPQTALANQQAQGRATVVADQREFLAQQSRQICRGLLELATIASTARPDRFANALYSPAADRTRSTATDLGRNDLDRITDTFSCPPIFEKYPDLLPLVVEYATTIEGAVRVPGPYPVLPGTPVSDVIAEAGGLTRVADLKRVEVTHFAADADTGNEQTDRQLVQVMPAQLATLAISPGDVVRFNPLVTDRATGQVGLTGEFRRPAYYDITRGERLSSLIQRAGGLTDQAYPYGAIFTRERVREQERQEFIRASEQLQAGLTAAIPRSGEQSQALVLATQQLVSQLRNTEPLGRVVIEADPTVLQVKPQLDPILEPGDTIFIPKRPFYVAVAGEVLNPTSLLFKSGATPKDYIDEAGGFTQTAEEGRVFVVLPNGQAQPVKTSFWNFTSVEVPPGSTIIVPKDLTPFDLSTFLKDSTQILSQLAISAASLAILHDNSTR